MFTRGRLAMPSIEHENVRHATLLFCAESANVRTGGAVGIGHRGDDVPRSERLDMRTRRGREAFVAANYERAVEAVRTTGRASVAHLQRQLCIVYSQAVLLIDELEKRGVIGPKRPGWPTREILAKTGK